MSRYDVHGMMKDDAAIEAWVRETVLGNWHACGSCRMGSEKDRMAVVDRVGRVYGTAGLRVCDASIMPTVPCANTNLSTIMIAEKISAAMIAEPA
jgi:5-(hydroxymethyl)furfural/furfural oxidase